MQEPFNEEDGIKAVHEAYARGINSFDTSPYYGNCSQRRQELLCCITSS